MSEQEKQRILEINRLQAQENERILALRQLRKAKAEAMLEEKKRAFEKVQRQIDEAMEKMKQREASKKLLNSQQLNQIEETELNRSKEKENLNSSHSEMNDSNEKINETTDKQKIAVLNNNSMIPSLDNNSIAAIHQLQHATAIQMAAQQHLIASMAKTSPDGKLNLPDPSSLPLPNFGLLPNPFAAAAAVAAQQAHQIQKNPETGIKIIAENTKVKSETGRVKRASEDSNSFQKSFENILQKRNRKNGDSSNNKIGDFVKKEAEDGEIDEDEMRDNGKNDPSSDHPAVKQENNDDDNSEKELITVTNDQTNLPLKSALKKSNPNEIIPLIKVKKNKKEKKAKKLAKKEKKLEKKLEKEKKKELKKLMKQQKKDLKDRVKKLKPENQSVQITIGDKYEKIDIITSTKYQEIKFERF